jgi:uncharacterized membrane protein
MNIIINLKDYAQCPSCFLPIKIIWSVHFLDHNLELSLKFISCLCISAVWSSVCNS